MHVYRQPSKSQYGKGTRGGRVEGCLFVVIVWEIGGSRVESSSFRFVSVGRLSVFSFPAGFCCIRSHLCFSSSVLRF